MRKAPLAGIRVLDLTRLLPGPVASLHLADLGAEVLKIEDPSLGDYARSMGPSVEGESQFFRAINRNKKFLTLDLKHNVDRARFTELIESADALIEGFRPGVMDRLGFGWSSIHETNPRLVMCSISGYGQDGPLSTLAGHDVNYLGFTGMLEQMAGEDGVPVLPSIQIGDLLGGAQSAVIGILAALIDARASGVGRYVDVSMTDAVFAHNVFALARVNASGRSAEPGQDLLTGGVACYNIYRTRDDRFMAVGALEAKFWEQMCDILELGQLKREHWSNGQIPGSDAARHTRSVVAEKFRAEPQSHWVELFSASDCCVTPVLRTEEALEHPHFIARGMVLSERNSKGVAARHAALPLKFSEPFFEVWRGAQIAGADNEDFFGAS